MTSTSTRLIPQSFGSLYGLMGFVAALLGTLIAIALVPQDVSPRGALRLPAIVLAMSFLFVPIVSSIGGFRNAFRCENVASCALVYWVLLDLLQGAYPLVGMESDTARYGLFLTGSFVCMLWIGAMLRPVRPPESLVQLAAIELTPKAVFQAIIAFFTLCMLRYAIACKFDVMLMFSSLSRGRFSTPWASSHAGGWNAFMDHLSYFGYLLPAMTVVLYNRSRGMNFQVGLSVVMSLIAMIFIGSGGGRRIYGVMILAALATWVLSRRNIGIRHLALSGALMLSLLLALQCVLYIRSTGIENSEGASVVSRAMSAFTGSSREDAGKYDHIHVDDNFLRLCQISEIVPAKHPHVYHQYIWWVAVRPIPRIIWPGKPLDGGFNLTEEVGAQASLSSSIIGELYLSMGAAAVLLGGFLYGRLATLPATFLYGSSKTLSPLIAGYLTMVIFVGTRSMIEIVLFSYSIVFLVAASRIWNHSSFRKKRSGHRTGHAVSHSRLRRSA